MRLLLYKIFVFQLFFVSLIVCHKLRNILINEFKDKTKSLDDLNVWRNKLKDEFKQNLQKLPDNVKKGIVENADKELKNNWEPLLATTFLEFKINGNRDHYESKNNIRRRRLQLFVLAELLTDKGKYLNEVANGIWLMLEKSTWMWPAHLYMQKAGVGLPDPQQYVIDLGAGEESAYVAWLNFLIGDKLSKLSPVFSKRIDFELDRRIIQTYLHNDFFWTGLDGHGVNNWNIWINTNVLMTTLLNVNNITDRYHIIDKIIKSADDWINWYGDDGGCDEGPSYWYQAGGRFIQFLYYISSASNHQLNWSSNQLFNNIGSYIYKMHIDRNYFVNFADAAPIQIPDPTLVYSFGRMFNNSLMKGFASYLYQMVGNESFLISEENHHDQSGNLHLYNLQVNSHFELKNIVPKPPQPLESWFPDLQVVTLRSQEGSAKGLFIGAKAGTNGESHNHNDVGNFILYVNGLPALIDVGVGVYSAKTFGAHRYDIWSMQSQWHNTPTINGVQQHDGGSFKAKNVSYTHHSNGGEFVSDIAGAYPKEAHIKSWVRKLTFDRTTNTLDLSESYSLEKFVVPPKIHFVTALNSTHVLNSGEVVLKDNNIKLVMKFDEKLLDVQIDEHKTEDEKLAHYWGERVHRVSLLPKNKGLEGKHSVVFHL